MQCVMTRWRAISVLGGVATVDVAPAAGGSQRMTLKIDGAVGRVLEISPSGGGSSIRYWNRGTDLGSGKPPAVLAIEDGLVP
jgi:hypothetical protein